MAVSLRALALLAVAVVLATVAVPPVIENQLEPGFCSAGCPVQHDGYRVAVTPPPPPSAVRRASTLAVAASLAASADLVACASPDAPRAPPAA